MNKLIVLIGLFLFLAACSPTPAVNSGIQGQVLIGPLCPVVQAGVPCPDQPYQATLTVLTQAGMKIVRFQTAADGTFQQTLPPGEYILRPESPGPMPSAPEQTFIVVEGQFTVLAVTYDSGIR